MLSSQASCVIVSRFRAGLDLDTYPLRNLIRPRCAERAKPGRVLFMHIGFFACFLRHISRTQSFQQNRHIIFLALVALKLLVSLISRSVACSPRIVVDTHTHTQTDTQNDYCNPRCACAPRVNYTVVVLSFCLLPRFLPLRATRRLISDTNGFSATLALF